MSSTLAHSSQARFDSTHTLRWLSPLVLCALAGLSACSLAPSNGEALSGESEALKVPRSSGSVHDALGAPIPAARIELLDGTGRPVASGISAPDGSYWLAPRAKHLSSGKYSLVVTPRPESGFAPRTFSDQEFSSGSALDVVLVKLLPTTISGRVLDTTNNPVENQRACLNGTISYDCTETLADGTFTVSTTAGEYSLDLMGDLQGPGDSGSTAYHVSEGFSAHDFVSLGDFKLETYLLRGEVRDASDAPVKQAALLGGPFHPNLPGDRSWTLSLRQMVTDSDGRFQITVLPFEGFLSAMGTSLGSVPIAPGQTDVSIRLPTPVHVTGRLLDATNAPFGSGNVCLQGQYSRCSTPSPDGTFDIVVSPGQYRLSFSYSLWLTWPDRTSLGLQKTTPLSVDSDTALGDIRIKTYQLSGELRTSESGAVAGATVSAESLPVSFDDFSGSLSFARLTDASGHFQTIALPASGELQALAPGHPGTTASLSPSQTNVVLTLPPGLHVSGRVVDASGTPLPDQKVCLSNGTESCTQSLADGTFSLLVAAGEYQLGLAGNLPETEADAWASYRIQRTHALQVGADTTLGDVKLQTRTLSARVLDSGTDPLPASNVSATMQISFDDFRGTADAGGTSDADGRFRGRVLAGEASLRFLPGIDSDFLAFQIQQLDFAGDASFAVSVQYPSDAPAPRCSRRHGHAARSAR